MPVTRTSGQGRFKGSRNKLPAAVKDMILAALADVGGRDYLVQQARANPVAFLSLLGKVLPLQLANADDNKPVRIIYQWADAAPVVIDHEPGAAAAGGQAD